jgi:uncharacterized protein YcbK (DUF882 family)
MTNMSMQSILPTNAKSKAWIHRSENMHSITLDVYSYSDRNEWTGTTRITFQFDTAQELNQFLQEIRKEQQRDINAILAQSNRELKKRRENEA